MTFAWPFDDDAQELASVRILRRLNHIATQNHAIAHKLRQLGETMALDFTRVNADLANETTLDDGIISLLNQIAAELRGVGGDPAADQAQINALADQLEAQAANISNAIQINTPPPAGGQIATGAGVAGTATDPAPFGGGLGPSNDVPDLRPTGQDGNVLETPDAPPVDPSVTTVSEQPPVETVNDTPAPPTPGVDTMPAGPGDAAGATGDQTTN